MHKSATKCNETVGKWYINKHGASKIIDTLETYQRASGRPETLERSGEKERRDRCASARGECFLRAVTDYDYGGPPAATSNVIDPQAATPRAASALIS
jgi:hypothetical protein